MRDWEDNDRDVGRKLYDENHWDEGYEQNPHTEPEEDGRSLIEMAYDLAQLGERLREEIERGKEWGRKMDAWWAEIDRRREARLAREAEVKPKTEKRK